ncbi:uncharacterized protein [Epargyreus clarus]|uniref:uncharacterized protein n=1 Tax=Epargyreus clarus TaxID=520877 RepID=UPI003C2DF599
MAEYYNIVPWSNSKEWLDLCEKLDPATPLESKKEALEQLLVWKSRCPFLPSGIESTLTLLEVTINDATLLETCDAANDQMLRLAYSTAIMRFVNHMFDGETAKGTSLYQAAINLHVPSWVVDLRHDTAHSNTLPTLQLLRDASVFSCNWLYEHYWLKHKPFIKDYISSDKVVIEENEYKIGALMNFCVSLSVCVNAKCNIKNLADIPDVYMRESILNDAHELFGNNVDVSNLKTTSISSLINLMTTQSKKVLEIKDDVSHINKVLLSEDSLILSLELLNQLDNNAFYNRRSLTRQYVQCFEVLLTFLHTNDLLQDFVLELIQLTQNNNDGNKCLLAALWVAEILKGLKRCKDFADKMKKVTPDSSSKKRKDLRSLYYHWFPSDKNSALILDLQKALPGDLTNIQFLQPIISSYNPYLTYFIRDLLNIIQPQLPRTIIDNICKLAELIAFPEKFPAKSSKVYTIDDLKTNDVTNSVGTGCKDLPSEAIHNNKDNKQVGLDANGIWKNAQQNEFWSSCPIGKLPWQFSSYS